MAGKDHEGTHHGCLKSESRERFKLWGDVTIFGVTLPSLVKLLWKYLHRHGQRCISQASVDTAKPPMKSNTLQQPALFQQLGLQSVINKSYVINNGPCFSSLKDFPFKLPVKSVKRLWTLFIQGSLLFLQPFQVTDMLSMVFLLRSYSLTTVI